MKSFLEMAAVFVLALTLACLGLCLGWQDEDGGGL